MVSELFRVKNELVEIHNRKPRKDVVRLVAYMRRVETSAPDEWETILKEYRES